jgi:hypothetical protein
MKEPLFYLSNARKGQKKRKFSPRPWHENSHNEQSTEQRDREKRQGGGAPK